METATEKTIIAKIYINAINAQNAILAELSNNINQSYSTDDRKTYYKNIVLRGNNTYVFLLICIYYGLFLWVLFRLYKYSTYSIRIKILIAFMFLIYPFVIGYVETKIYNVLSLLSALVTGEIYTRTSKPYPEPSPPPSIKANVF